MARKSKTVTKTFRLNEELLEKANEYVAWYEKVYDEKITLTSRKVVPGIVLITVIEPI